MKKSNNTVLITGGSSGIGLELAGRLIQRNNKVLICGRSALKLQQTKKKYPSIEVYQCDLSVPEEIRKLSDWVTQNHPECNVLINNAAVVHKEDFESGSRMIEKARKEIETNLMAPITLSKNLLPVLGKNAHPEIINITTGLVYTPRIIYPFYNATKAALHSFTIVLREQLRESPVGVTEVLFPAVETPWHKGNPPDIAISVKEAVDEMLHEIERGKREIRVGKVKLLFFLSKIAPGIAFKKINSLR